jgi:N-acetylmuramoyl-L-alanine amidase
VSVEINAGDTCIVSRDVLIGDALAFQKGEALVVEAVVPDALRPEYRYVVNSRSLGARYALSDADIHMPDPSVPLAARQQSQWKALIVAAGLAVLALTVFVIFLSVMRGSGSSTSSTGPPALVCLDPGHGGSDTGALENGVAEKDVNLDIALRAKTVLEAKGFRVIMTRDADRAVSLAQRCAIANNAHAKLFVSIHNNARPPDTLGTTTYYFRDSSPGRLLAAFVQQEVVWRINQPNRGIKASRLYVVRNVGMPAALLEGVFLTNKSEATLIQLPSFRQAIADGIAAAIHDYLK